MKSLAKFLRPGDRALTFIFGLAVGHFFRPASRVKAEQNNNENVDVLYDDAGDMAAAIESNAIIGIDFAQRIVIANAAAAALFGAAAEEMLGSRISRFIVNHPTQDSSLATAHPDQVNGAGTTRLRRFTDFNLTGLHVNGASIPLDTAILHRTTDREKLAIILIKDNKIRQQMRARLARSHEELRQLSSALQTIREEERTYLARELHDDLGQLLSTLRLDLDILQQSQGIAEQRVRLIAGMQDNLASSIASLRRMATHLRPRALDDGDLYSALLGLRDEFAQRYSISCTLYADESELQLDDARSTVLFRIVQEALTNIARHAQARAVTLSLYRIDGELLLTIRDDGRGINYADMKKAGSLGLVGMRERVWGLNGQISVTRGESSGTSIDIVIPITGPVE